MKKEKFSETKEGKKLIEEEDYYHACCEIECHASLIDQAHELGIKKGELKHYIDHQKGELCPHCMAEGRKAERDGCACSKTKLCGHCDIIIGEYEDKAYKAGIEAEREKMEEELFGRIKFGNLEKTLMNQKALEVLDKVEEIIEKEFDDVLKDSLENIDKKYWIIENDTAYIDFDLIFAELEEKLSELRKGLE